MIASKRNRKTPRHILWFEKAMAAIASVNLGLVLFDLSYVPYRDLYVRRFCLVPTVCFQLPSSWHQYYDKKKGIEPHRETQNYLQTVDALKNQVQQTGIDSPEVEPILAQLRQMSTQMIDENPFQIANKTGTLERLKNRMRDRMGNDSSKQAFNQFWNPLYLTAKNWNREISFFENNIRPYIASNYFRRYSETGEFVNKFWQIDLMFNLLFAIEFITRTRLISRRFIGVKWIPDALLWRWYDVFLILPFSLPFPLMNPAWGLMRVLPVTIRLGQAKLVNLNPLWRQINRGIIANFASALTEIVIIQTIDQLQNAIRNDLQTWLTNSVQKRYIDLNNVNEIEAISGRLVKLSVYQVLPKIKPDLEEALRYSVKKGLAAIPMYQELDRIPGIGNLSKTLTEQMVDGILKNVYDLLTASIEDPQGAQLTSQLVQSFSDALICELKQGVNLQEMQILMCEFLDEVKINYVKRLEEEDIEQLIAETEKLHQRPKPNSQSRSIQRRSS
ncbi:MAG: hypothetical protein WBD58_10285 [Geitlerinemataceae cyanobacterium]